MIELWRRQYGMTFCRKKRSLRKYGLAGASCCIVSGGTNGKQGILTDARAPQKPVIFGAPI